MGGVGSRWLRFGKKRRCCLKFYFIPSGFGCARSSFWLCLFSCCLCFFIMNEQQFSLATSLYVIAVMLLYWSPMSICLFVNLVFLVDMQRCLKLYILNTLNVNVRGLWFISLLSILQCKNRHKKLLLMLVASICYSFFSIWYEFQKDVYHLYFFYLI